MAKVQSLRHVFPPLRLIMWYQKDSRRWTWSRTRDLMCLRHRQTPPYNRMPNSSLPQQLMGLELLRCQWPSPSSQLLDTGPPQIHTSSTESGVATCGMHFIKGKVREQRLWFTAFPFHVSPPSLSTNPSGRGIGAKGRITRLGLAHGGVSSVRSSCLSLHWD